MNVVLHILNALLVVALARRIVTGRAARWVGLAAGVLFLSFPVSYQAVPWVASLTHPLATFLVLGSLLIALRAASKPAGWLRAASLGLAAAAFFAHESALVIGVLLLAFYLLRPQPKQTIRGLGWPLAYIALAVAYVPIYFAIPRQTSALPPFTVARFVQTGAYLLQGLAYPVAPAGRLLMAHLGWSDLTSAYLAAGVTVVLFLVIALRHNRLRELGLALAWFAIAVLPASLVLSYDYIINAPRVLYLASVGTTIAWAVGIGDLVSDGRRRIGAPSKGLALLGLAAVLVFSFGFVRERQATHRLGGDLIWQASETIAAAPADEEHLVVNYPAWLAPGRIVYPVGHEGVEFMPRYVGVDDLVWANSGTERDVFTAKFANELPPWPGYYYGIRGPEVSWDGLAERIWNADRVQIVHLGEDALQLRAAGRVVHQSVASAEPMAVFGERVTLSQADLAPVGRELAAVRLVWRSDGPLTDADYRVFVHLYDAAGGLVAQSDGYPINGLFPFWMWRHGDVVEEVRYLTIGSQVLPGWVRAAVGIYDADSGERLPAVGPDGGRFPDDAVPIATAPASNAVPHDMDIQ